MAEPQLAPSVAGQELQRPDVDLVGKVAGLQDDRVIAEILRLAPYDGSNVFKCVIPYTATTLSASPDPGPTVQPSGSADGSVKVFPFRAVIGSRTAVGTNVLDNWRDVRSGIWTGSAALSQSFQLAANSSGNPRWDLVYAAVSVDVGANNKAYRIKAPSGGTPSVSTLPQYLACTVSIQVLAGTPGATPTRPAVPADSGSVYNVPLAYVRVPNGFNATTTISPRDIRVDATQSHTWRTLRGGIHARPADGNNDAAATYSQTGHFAWAAGSAGTRPPPFIPPDMVGGECIFAEIDCIDASSANWSHADGAIVDQSIDWRNRFILCFAYVSTGLSPLATDTSNGVGGVKTPNGYSSGGGLFQASAVTDWSMSSTLTSLGGNDGLLVASKPTVISFNDTKYASRFTATTNFGLYVEPSDGTLRWKATGTGSTQNPLSRLALWLFASPYMGNV